MGDSQQDGKKRSTYEKWTKQESDVLLKLMVDAASRGWTDNNGNFSKQTVDERILPVLNSKLGCQKNYNNYQSRLKWFKKRWLSYSSFFRLNSDFGFDSMTKRFTAPDKVWNDYLKAHPTDGTLRDRVFDDYDDLKIIFGNDGATRRNSKGLDNNTNVGILEAGEGRRACIEDLNYIKAELTEIVRESRVSLEGLKANIHSLEVKMDKLVEFNKTSFENIYKYVNQMSTIMIDIKNHISPTNSEINFISDKTEESG